MKILAILLALTLTACTTVVPVVQKFPSAPGLQAQQSCPALKKLELNAQLSDVAKTVAANYEQYYICAVKTDAWIEWYAQQKIIYESLK